MDTYVITTGHNQLIKNPRSINRLRNRGPSSGHRQFEIAVASRMLGFDVIHLIRFPERDDCLKMKSTTNKIKLQFPRGDNEDRLPLNCLLLQV